MPSAGIAAFLIGITIATVFYFFFPSSEEEPTATSAHHVERSNSSNRYYESEPCSYKDSRRRRSHPYERKIASGTCSICLDPLTTGVRVVVNPCNHGFHQKCILEWVSVANPASCPNCRCKIKQ